MYLLRSEYVTHIPGMFKVQVNLLHLPDVHKCVTQLVLFRNYNNKHNIAILTFKRSLFKRIVETMYTCVFYVAKYEEADTPLIFIDGCSRE